MAPEDEGVAEVSDRARHALARAFGAENRGRLVDRYFDGAGEVTCANAWRHIYRLLLWIDRTTALAHCYESDKAQPGRVWYARSLAFHDWISTALGVPPSDLGERIDWLFREAVRDLANRVLATRTAAYEAQRGPYQGRGFPEPGEDAELVGIVKDALGRWINQAVPEEAFRVLTRRLYVYMTQENKRRNLVGEGFEDVVAGVVGRLPVSRRLEIRSRTALHELPGFHAPAPNEKAKKVDLAFVRGKNRILVSVKWSIRADREEQFQSDFESYARLESAGRDFGYTLITNEFDAARLKAACERRKQNASLFTDVVHICPEAVLAAYGNARQGSVNDLRAHIFSGRLMSLDNWLDQKLASL
ncbi:MAG: hypothetical protein HY322_21005 [Betaproteobacteria bacterium]|nr:hypothetical protein [Betaproteobacteria bacterium]